MSPEYERACMAAVGLVPIPFDLSEHAKCAGRVRINGRRLPLCYCCARLSEDGGIEPAARMVGGVAECVNFKGHE